MLRQLPPILQFIFVSMIGVLLGTVAGLINEFLQKPFSATNAVIWLFLMLVSGGMLALIFAFSRNRLK